MAVTEAERHRRYETLKSSLGDQDAETFMNLMPPANWAEFAMKSDIAELRTEIAVFRTELKTDVADVRTEIAGLRTEIADRSGQLLRTFGTWLFVSQAGVIAAVTLVVALLN